MDWPRIIREVGKLPPDRFWGLLMLGLLIVVAIITLFWKSETTLLPALAALGKLTQIKLPKEKL